jgi:hypothetical protein
VSGNLALKTLYRISNEIEQESVINKRRELLGELIVELNEVIILINGIEESKENEVVYDLSKIILNLKETILILKDSRFLDSESIDELYNQIKQLKDKDIASEVKDNLNSLEYEKAIIILEKILLEFEK